MLGADNLRKVAGYDFHLLRKKKCDVQSMWGDLDPQWRLLKSQLETKGLAGIRPLSEKSGFYKLVESAWWWHERGTTYWWRPCSVAGLVYHAEPALAFTPTCSTLGVFGRTRDFSCHVYPSRGGRTNNFPSINRHSGGCIDEGTKKEEAGWRQCPDWVATMLRVWYMARLLVAWCYVRVLLHLVTSSYGLFTWRGSHCSICLPVIGSWSDWILLLQAHIDDLLVGHNRLARLISYFHCYCLEDGYDALLVFGGLQGSEP